MRKSKDVIIGQYPFICPFGLTCDNCLSYADSLGRPAYLGVKG
jgi:hypothetical protein